MTNNRRETAGVLECDDDDDGDEDKVKLKENESVSPRLNVTSC